MGGYRAYFCLILGALMCLSPPGASAEDVARKRLAYTVLKTDVDGRSEDPSSCLLISHDCETCALNDRGDIVCSSVGIACEPTEIRCYTVTDGK